MNTSQNTSQNPTTKMNNCTRQIAIAYLQYRQSTLYTLTDCYKTPSMDKRRQYQAADQYCKSLNGSSSRILHYNTFRFYVGFTYVDPTTDTLTFCWYVPGSKPKHCPVSSIQQYIVTHDLPPVLNHG